MTTDNTIDSYLTKMQEGLAKQYLFKIVFQFPWVITSLAGNQNIITDIPYYVRSSNLPESTFEDSAVAYPGYTLKMAGNRIYNDWTVSFNIDRSNNILKLFQDWHDYIYNPQNHTYAAPKDYMIHQFLQLVNEELKITSTCTLYGAWPKVIGNITMDYSSSEFANVDITFAYQYYMISRGTEDNG